MYASDVFKTAELAILKIADGMGISLASHVASKKPFSEAILKVGSGV